MGVGEKDKGKGKLPLQVPWIPTTPSKPILPRPAPICTPGEGSQLGSHFSGGFPCCESSAGAEINSPHLLSAHAAEVTNIAHDRAKTDAQMSFDNISRSTNGVAELLAPSGYSNATHDAFLRHHLVPTLNSQFNQTYTLLSQHHPFHGQPSMNTIQDNQDPHGTSYLACCSQTTSQVALPNPYNIIAAENRKVAGQQMNMKGRDQGGEEKNVSATDCNNPLIEFAAVSTPCKENNNLGKEISNGVDLNKIPQPKPKRRKHRPKVIREGKPERTMKPVTPKPVQSKENPTSKRKYVRRKGLNTTPQTEVEGESTKPLTPESANKTCRRSLNFDIGEPRDGNSTCRENTTSHFGREIGMEVEETQALNNHMSLQDPQAPSTILSKSNSPGAKPNANYVENGSKRRGWVINQDENQKILSKSVAQSRPNDSNSSNSQLLTTGLQVVGSKRKQSGTIEHADNSSINLFGAQYNVLQVYPPKYWIEFPNVQKKRRSEKGKSSNTSNTSSMAATEDVQLATCPQEDARSHPYASGYNCWTFGSEYNTVGVPVIPTAAEKAIHDKPQSFEYNLSLGQRRSTKRRSRVPTRIHDCASLTLIRNCGTNLTHTTKPGSSGNAERPQTCIDALVAEMGASLTKKKRTKKRSTLVSSAYSCTDKMQQHHKFVVENHSLPLHNSIDLACQETSKNIHSVDTLTEQFSHLNIYREARELVLHGQNALVPYDQQNQKHKGLVHEYGTIIPFEGSFDPIKRQRPRPKVDLDEETNRVWKLLMLDINSHGIDGSDEEKAKRWEEERNVFRGRADSFIARMHLVQGDRRFSQWKGSVVDSVIGVFLTQNVSDHLSSSAFMSLAARFPLKSSNKYNTYHEEKTSLMNNPQVHIVEPEEHTKIYEKTLNQSVYELSSLTVDTIEHSEEREAVDSNDSCRTTGTDGSICKLLESAQQHDGEHSPMESISAMTGERQENSCHQGVQKELNDLFSSQCPVITPQISGDSSIDQNTEKIGSLSDSNPEMEDQSSMAKYNLFYNRTSFSKLLEMASSPMLNSQSISNETMGDAYGQSAAMRRENRAENLEKSNITQGCIETSSISCNEYTLKMPNSGVLEVNCYDPLKIQTSSSGTLKNKDENDKRSSFPTRKSKSQAAVSHSQSKLSQFHLQQQSDHKHNNVSHISGQTQDLKQKSRELDFGDHNYAKRNENSKMDSAAVKLRGRERGKEKKDDFDWDSLRIQAQAKAGKREKTENTMDSLDWDAVRRADVKEIADAIKERGMNNMLAERIKNFLNLLVDVHGGIDLEWLRDVPPQPFPKLARLALPGPEQKSMVITTGNNATYQSPSVVINQLPLPLPENTNQAEELQQTEVMRQLETKSEINICQPIIEEPATPEPECSQVLENDIEDAVYEESCEIPTIKLDIEEFTMNLQNYMQENMELQEGEMSKALVALNSEVAHIPTPKLKNVSRLRTEHSVYELPDSHHLLEGWDKREPDDPGKYLLAIWTPGETANSIQPPERKCSSQDSGQLCNENECFSCNSFREANSQIVRGTILIPCRTAMRGSFPLNGTYFQVNEVFADHDSSLNPISVPRSWIWNLNRRTVYFGTSIPSIFKGLSTQEIQQCFWRGYVCVRGFERQTRAPRPLMARLHFPASKLPKNKDKAKKEATPASSQGLNLKPNPEQPELLSNTHG